MIPAYCDKLPSTKSSKHNRVLFAPSETSPVAAGVMTIGSQRALTEEEVAELIREEDRYDMADALHVATRPPTGLDAPKPSGAGAS